MNETLLCMVECPHGGVCSEDEGHAGPHAASVQGKVMCVWWEENDE